MLYALLGAALNAIVSYRIAVRHGAPPERAFREATSTAAYGLWIAWVFYALRDGHFVRAALVAFAAVFVFDTERMWRMLTRCVSTFFAASVIEACFAGRWAAAAAWAAAFVLDWVFTAREA